VVAPKRQPRSQGAKLGSRQTGGGRAGGGLMVCRWYGLTLRRGKEEVQITYRRLAENCHSIERLIGISMRVG